MKPVAYIPRPRRDDGMTSPQRGARALFLREAGYSREAIAERLGVSLNAVSKLLVAARKAKA